MRRKAADTPALSEDHIQRAVILHLQYRSRPGVVFWHTPNGGKRNVVEAKRFVAMGVKPGIPDIMILADGQLYGLELKAAKGRVSEHQKKCLADLAEAGAITAVTYGLDEAVERLEAWGLIDGGGSALRPATALAVDLGGASAP